MFKLLISCVMLALFAIAIAAIIKIVLGVQEKRSSLPDENLPIDDIIDELEFKIHRAEVLAEKGVKEAEDRLTLLKSELNKAKEIKNKLK